MKRWGVGLVCVAVVAACAALAIFAVQRQRVTYPPGHLWTPFGVARVGMTVKEVEEAFGHPMYVYQKVDHGYSGVMCGGKKWAERDSFGSASSPSLRAGCWILSGRRVFVIFDENDRVYDVDNGR